MPATHHSGFYRPDALPAAHPTASKHWRQCLQCSLKSVSTNLSCKNRLQTTLQTWQIPGDKSMQTDCSHSHWWAGHHGQQWSHWLGHQTLGHQHDLGSPVQSPAPKSSRALRPRAKYNHTLLPHARLCNTARSALAERSEKNLLTLSSTWQNLARPSQHSFVITAVLREFLGAHHGTWCTVWQPRMLNWARLALCSLWASFIASQYEFNKLFIDSTQKCCYYEVQRCA